VPQPSSSKPQDEKQGGKQDDQSQEEKDQPTGRDPKDNKGDDSEPKQVNTDQPAPESETAVFEKDTDKDRWGLLPPKEAEDLQRHRMEEFPQRYRLWMEMYYRRVNSSRRGR